MIAPASGGSAALHEPVRALVLWADRRSANLGVRALAEGTAAVLGSILPTGSRVDLQDFAGLETSVSMSRNALIREVLGPSKPVARHIRSYELLWDTGAGDSLTDSYGLKRLAAMLYVGGRAAPNQVLVRGPQTIGPFSTTIARRLTARALRRADVVMARDAISADLCRSLGRPVDGTTSDVVFALPVGPVDSSRDILLNVSGLLWSGLGSHVDAREYRRMILLLARRLLAAGRSVSILAHVLDNPSLDNDLIALDAVEEEFGSALEYITPADLWQARRYIASANLVIGSRMHACLNAISQGVPALPLAYSRKFEPLFVGMGWPYCIDLRRSGVTVETIERTVLELLQPNAFAQAQAVAERAREGLVAAAEAVSGVLRERGGR